MKRNRLTAGSLTLAALLWIALVGQAAAETVEWERTPIPVTLAVGVERQLRFEGPATVGVPADIVESGALRAQFANDTAYWLANAPFGARRIKVRLERTGEFVLFDVNAVVAGGGTAEPLEVRIRRPERDGIAPAEGAAEDPRAGIVSLIRNAARLDLAPPRLAGLPAGTVLVETAATDATGLYRQDGGNRLRLDVLRQLSRGGLFVTTVEASNRSPDRLEVDVRRLRAQGGPRSGAWEGFAAIGWTRSTLAPAGEPGFTARFYLVSREPFDLVAEAVP